LRIAVDNEPITQDEDIPELEGESNEMEKVD